MTDYELASLFADYLNTANFVFSNFMALIFAMLTASYFLAHRMGLWVSILFLLLYSIAALMTGSGAIFAFSDFAGLGSHIHAVGANSPDLAWLGPVQAGENMDALPVFVTALVAISYVGSIGFFIIVRANRIHADKVKQEAEA